MNTLAIRDYLYRAKAVAHRFPPIAAANRAIKARRLRNGLRRLVAHYAALAAPTGTSYREDAAWAECRQRVTVARSTATTRQSPGLRIFWVGANRDQDESGFLQALRRIANVIEFRNWKGGYGQWYWDSHGRVRVFDPAIVALNDKALIAQVEASLQEGSIDLLMGQMWANYISKEALASVRRLGIPIINISMDDRLPDNWSSRRGTRLGAIGLAPVSDLVLTTSSETCAWYGAEGCPAVFWPLASDPDVFKPDPTAPRNIDVLFIGNSYTYVNDLPGRVAAVANAQGDAPPIKVSSVTVGATALEDHWNNPNVKAAIAAGGNDFVVLQGQSVEPAASPTSFQTYAALLAGAVKTASATPVSTRRGHAKRPRTSTSSHGAMVLQTPCKRCSSQVTRRRRKTRRPSSPPSAKRFARSGFNTR